MSTWLVSRDELTPEQMRAIELSRQEHRVILGSPGSGKTQILARLGLKKRNVSLLDAFRCCPYVLRLAAELVEDEEAKGYLNQARTVQTEKETPLFYRAADFEDEKRRLIEIRRSI